MTLVRIQQLALLAAAALFVGCVAFIGSTKGGLFEHGALTRWFDAAGALLVAYGTGQPKITMFSTLSFGKYMPAIIGYWCIAAFWTADLMFQTNEATTRPELGAFAGHNTIANLTVGCTLVAIAIVFVIVGWLRLRPSIHRVDTVV